MKALRIVLALGIATAYALGACAQDSAAKTSASIDLKGAEIVASPSEATMPKILEMLQEEIARRTDIRLSSSSAMPATTQAAIVLGVKDRLPSGKVTPPEGLALPSKPQGYAIWTDLTSRQAPTLYLVGNDAQGMLFAVGRLLRILDMGKGTLRVASEIKISTAPRYPIRGHQLGYRNTANSYDAWDIATYEQYIRDLAIFGTNTIELIPSTNPSFIDGPVMKETIWARTMTLNHLITSYGLDLSWWLPVDEDLAKPGIPEKALESRRELFKACSRLDALFVPGGDDGSNPAQLLMPWLKDLSKLLAELHPEAKLWVSNQTFEPPENDYFFKFLQDEQPGVLGSLSKLFGKKQPSWLEGVVYGPWMKLPMATERERTASSYRLRRYPDLTHCTRCQYPVSDWDRAFAFTLGREPMCPRPRAMAHIHNLFAPLADGFVSYSDGIHDDLNKFVWSVMGWDPDCKIEDLVREYAKVFFGDQYADSVAAGLFMLEDDWKGQVVQNRKIEKTLEHWQSIAEKGGADLADNWRFQMYLFRAYYDAYVKQRALAAVKDEERAYAALKRARQVGVGEAIAQAREALANADNNPAAAELRRHIEDLGPQLLKSIGYQLSVKEPYKAKNSERGAVLDWLDWSMNDRPWLEGEFKAIQAQGDEAAQLARIEAIVNWENPGPGGFYDDLGNTWKQPHLVHQKTWEEDPGFVQSPQCEFCNIEGGRLSWQDQAQTLFGAPLLMHYEGLDTSARYKLRVTYAGRFHAIMKLVADGQYEIHGPLEQPKPIAPAEFDIPQEATKDGVLNLEWQLVKQRGCQVAEVWLIKK